MNRLMTGGRTLDDVIMFPGDDQIQGVAALMCRTLHMLL